MPPLTARERNLANFYKLPASTDKIMSHLERLAMHKRMDSNDTDRNAYLLADYASRLSGITEIEMAIAVEHFIENDTNDFFPQYAKLKKWIKREFESSPWSEYAKK